MTTTSEPIPIPRIERDGIVLRPHTADDADEVLTRSRDTDTRRYTSLPMAYTREMAFEYVTQHTAPSATEICWAVELDGRMAASIDLRTWGKGFTYGAANLGYVTSPWARGRGVMTRAVGLVCDEGFSRGLETITWDAHAGNVGSWKPVWRNGFHEFTYVPALLASPAGITNAWHALLRVGDPREPRGGWREAIENSATPPGQRGL